jgi:hypothetical protein
MDIICPSWEETRPMGSRLFESGRTSCAFSSEYWFLWFWFTVLISQREELIVWSVKTRRREETKAKAKTPFDGSDPSSFTSGGKLRFFLNGDIRSGSQPKGKTQEEKQQRIVICQ